VGFFLCPWEENRGWTSHFFYLICRQKLRFLRFCESICQDFCRKNVVDCILYNSGFCFNSSSGNAKVFLHSKQCQLNNFGPKNLKTFELRTQRSINKNKVSWQNAFICYFFMRIRSPNLLSFFRRRSRTAVLGQIYSGKPKIIPRTPSAKRESLFGFALLSLYVLRSDTCIRLTLACFHLLSIFGFNFFLFRFD